MLTTVSPLGGGNLTLTPRLSEAVHFARRDGDLYEGHRSSPGNPRSSGSESPEPVTLAGSNLSGKPNLQTFSSAY